MIARNEGKGFLLTILKAHFGAVMLAAAFYAGSQSHHLVKRVEHNLFNGHLAYADNTHPGDLEVVTVENPYGKLEKVLVNTGTGQSLYTIQSDCLPPNEVIFDCLENRAKIPEERKYIVDCASRLIHHQDN